eukprot:14620025-Ditylum_brightwellii.AAC.1
MVDHASNFSHSHMIKGTLITDTVLAKDAYERVMSTYDYRVESYHGDSHRFDSKEFQDSCKLA